MPENEWISLRKNTKRIVDPLRRFYEEERERYVERTVEE
jgi:hypothetical protein